jgi:monofunctional biosynthetic peptidoglycan transglycosylase
MASPRPARRKRLRLRSLLIAVVRLLALCLVASLLLTLSLRWIRPPTSAIMIERRLEALWNRRAYRVDYRWSPLRRVSPSVPLAFIAAEDQNFASHNGFDFASIEKAVHDYERGRRLRGASTLSQQVAKNLFLWSGRSFVRKGLEAYFTVLIELTWSKRRILEVYTNIVELGNGVFGVEAASQRYFRKPAARMTPEEAALLAAVLPNPLQLRAGRPSSYVLQRRAWILQQMRRLGGSSYMERF